MNLRKILLTGSLALTLGACSVFSPSEIKENDIAKSVSIYRFKRVVDSIKGPFVKKQEKGYTSFAELSEDEKIKFDPILYQLDDNKNVYLDCQRDGFSGNEYLVNELLNLMRISKVSHTPEQLCKAIGY